MSEKSSGIGGALGGGILATVACYGYLAHLMYSHGHDLQGTVDEVERTIHGIQVLGWLLIGGSLLRVFFFPRKGINAPSHGQQIIVTVAICAIFGVIFYLLSWLGRVPMI